MKRFAMTISLAACLVFLCGVTASAQGNLVEVQSITVPPGAMNCSLSVWIDNAEAATAIVIPLEFREQTPGSYIAPMAGAVQNQFRRGMTSDGRLQNSPLGGANPQGPNASPIQNRYPTLGGVCNPATAYVGRTYQVPAAQVDFISPDGTMLESHSTGDEGIGDDIDLDAGADPPGTPSYYFAFGVTNTQGTFIVDTCCTTPANKLEYVNRQTVAVPFDFIAGIVTIFQPPNACPIVDPVPPQNAVVGAQTCVTLSATDPENDSPITFHVLSGPGTINGNQLCVSPNCADVANGIDVVVYADDPVASGCEADPNTTVHFNVQPQQLQISCGNVSVHWAGADAAQQIGASGGCPPYTYTKESGVGTVDANGAWSYNQDCGDVGSSQVTIRVTDSNQDFVECTFTLTVNNIAPVCANIPPTLAPQGVETVIDLGDLAQADGDALVYTLITGTGWADEDITGDTWSATRPGGDGASYTVTYTVSDGCVTITCQFDVIFENPCIAIVKQGTDSSYGCWFNGQQATVCVVAEGGAVPGDAGGFDFLICYDQSGLSFLSASGGPQGWEYFTYRTGQFGGNCSGGCPDGYVHLIGIADMNNGLPVDPADFNLDGKTLACLTFNVTSDRNFINSCLHVGFCSFDCGDNVVSDKSGNITWTPRDGVNLGPYYSCDGNNKPTDSTVPAISYCPGAICVCEPPDDRGDLNLNGIANEIGDAVLYTNYFIYGSSVWDPTWEAVQILASDINDDGVVLTVADLIYLIRIITGDESPFPPGTGNGSPKVSPYVNSVDVSNDVANGAITVRTTSTSEIGAALLVFRYDGSIGAPVLANNSGLIVRSNASNGELRVLVSQTVESAAARLTSGSNSLVTIPVNGTIELVESQFSDVNGGLLEVSSAAAVVPTSYALEQNYPNPFNAGTVIPFTLVEGSRYELSIYNVAGQVVRTFAGDGVQGLNRVEWNGRTEGGAEAATGMYFYRLTANNYIATKKMVLLK
jgi:hypothetical protein